jgi:23S rRNA pseudouridine1911/1915/1917 synthase
MIRRLLPPPTVLFSNNHLLVVNKPPGWSSIPKKTEPEKSLLDHLISLKLGGGSKNDFLIPLHRIDQPCSGVLLLAKTGKAASRVTQIWKKGLVEKTYLCVLEEPLNMEVFDNADHGWNLLEGWVRKGKTVGSVKIVRTPPRGEDHDMRQVSLEWRNANLVAALDHSSSDPSATTYLVEVKTHMGTRHMVRTLMASVLGHSIAGDLRYRARQALPDKSVALHAQSVTLPESFLLGSLEQERYFEAPIPVTWKKYFGTQRLRGD